MLTLPTLNSISETLGLNVCHLDNFWPTLALRLCTNSHISPFGESDSCSKTVRAATSFLHLHLTVSFCVFPRCVAQRLCARKGQRHHVRLGFPSKTLMAATSGRMCLAYASTFTLLLHLEIQSQKRNWKSCVHHTQV